MLFCTFAQYVPNSLYCLDRKNTFRRAIVALIEWPWFDRFILVLILANSIVLALTDYQTLDENGEPSNASWRNAVRCCVGDGQQHTPVTHLGPGPTSSSPLLLRLSTRQSCFSQCPLQ